MEISYKRTSDMHLVKESMSAIKGKKPNAGPLDPKMWFDMLLTPHSTVRCISYRIYIKDIPYYAHTHLVRHKIGIEPTVYSQRSDVNRGKRTQDELISMHIDVNAQALLKIAQVRLCKRADKVMQDLMNLIKEELSKGDVYDQILGSLMLPNCELCDGICPEVKPCGKSGVRTLKDIHQGKLMDMLNQ